MPRKALRFEIDASDFARTLDLTNTRVNAAVGRGLLKAARHLLNDIIDRFPKAPVLTSALISSITIFLNGVYKASSRKRAIASLHPKDHRIISAPKDHTPNQQYADIILGAPYSAFQHEVYHPGYVTQKLADGKTEYVKDIADEVKKVF